MRDLKKSNGFTFHTYYARHDGPELSMGPFDFGQVHCKAGQVGKKEQKGKEKRMGKGQAKEREKTTIKTLIFFQATLDFCLGPSTMTK